MFTIESQGRVLCIPARIVTLAGTMSCPCVLMPNTCLLYTSFIRPTAEELANYGEPDFVSFNASKAKVDNYKELGLNSETATVFNPVSYTHLDYIEEADGKFTAFEMKWNPNKRQTTFPSPFLNNYPIKETVITVSYTHLDVYKRQGYGCGC